MITAKKLQIEGKHKDPVECENFCRFIFFANRLMAFPIEEGNRRPFITKASNKYTKEVIGAKENKKHFDKLVSQYESKEYQSAFLEMLMKRDISNWNPKEFEKSELHQTLEDNSISPLVQYLANIVRENIGQETVTKSSTVALKEFSELLRSLNHKFDYTQQKFNTEMEANYGIKVHKASTMKMKFDIIQLRAMLEKKYKYNFSDVKEIDESAHELPLEEQIKLMENFIYARHQELLQLKAKLEAQKKVAVEQEKVPPEEEDEKPKKISKTKKPKSSYKSFDDFLESNEIIEDAAAIMSQL
jgi:hypothetical protein